MTLVYGVRVLCIMVHIVLVHTIVVDCTKLYMEPCYSDDDRIGGGWGGGVEVGNAMLSDTLTLCHCCQCRFLHFHTE